MPFKTERPFAWSSAAIGWRETLGFVGIGTIVVAVIVWLVTPAAKSNVVMGIAV